MLKRVTRGWLVRAGIVSAVGAAVILGAVTMGSGRAHATGATISWAVSGGGNQPAGGTFTVNVNSSNFVPDVTQPTWGGYGLQIQYDPTVLSAVSVAAGGITSGCGPNWAQIPSSPGTILTTCVFQSSTAVSPPPTDVIQFKCLKAGSSPIHMVTLAEDSTQGSTFFDENAVNITTALTDGAANCVLPIHKSDDTGGTALAGATVNYTIHVGNPGASSSFGHSVTDTFDASLTGVTFVSGTPGYNLFGGSCGVASNTLTCTNVAVDTDPTGLDLVVSAVIPLSDAGQTICNTANIDSAVNSNNDCFNVSPASLTVTKAPAAGPYQAGDPISWTITVKSNGPSTAAGVTVTDTPTDGWTVSGNTGGGSCVPATNTTWNCGNMASGATATFTISGNVTDPQPSDNNCNNSVSAASTNGASSSASAQVGCLSKNVRMVKSTDCNNAPTNSGQLVNLFLTKPVTSLTVCEWALNVGGDPQGVGAFEFDLKYDNHIFDIGIAPTSWLYDTGRWTDAAHDSNPAAGCTATIITENDIRFGCVSKNPQPLAGPVSCLGPDDVTPVVGAVCGNKDNGVIAHITITPKADLLGRITPGNDNGAIRSLLDEGCEFADIWGHPLAAAGSSTPLPGIAPGGQVTDCADITITVRILEGDMNTDCTVNVTDDQIEAAHYGAFFGSLLYDPWYDLEPAVKDYDVDIKDLQKVFGRNGSNCTDPVPPQPALPQPGDP